MRVRGHIHLSINRVKLSSSKCCHPLCNEKRNLHVVPSKIRLAVLKEERLFIPNIVKACPQHMRYESWLEIDSNECEHYFTKKQIEDMVDFLRKESTKKTNPSTGKKN